DLAAPVLVTDDTASVSDPPVVVIPSGLGLALVEGIDSGLVTLATFTEPGGLESLADYAATVDWGDGTPLDTATTVIVDHHDGTYGVQGRHTYAEESGVEPPGSTPYTLTVTILHDRAPHAVTGGTASVAEAPLIVVGAGVLFDAVEGQDTGRLTLATFIDTGG